jgi:hypothetical protein
VRSPDQVARLGAAIKGWDRGTPMMMIEGVGDVGLPGQHSL